ncbi:hypothetical protein Ccrd_015804 [Cynara cardunculus var. scolymus]|uniref:Uncharacterized protein n=1 Tax=Cynara cardunculus var. scolymus TaxID=59895 RepID=A0A118K3F4_CYNCS|nr:hypothetical protein Ccrd_015804 [Cynara cardunculus var. scolymus]
MATIDSASDYVSIQNRSQKRGMAMVFAMVTAIVLSPLYVNVGQKDAYLETRLWNSGFVLPMVLGGLIVAIKTTSSSSSSNATEDSSSSSLRIGRSSWGLAAFLGMLFFLLDDMYF